MTPKPDPMLQDEHPCAMRFGGTPCEGTAVKQQDRTYVCDACNWVWTDEGEPAGGPQ